MSIVGRDDAKSNSFKKPNLLFPTLGKGVAGNTYVDTINSRITSTSGLENFDVNTVPDLATDEFISALSDAQRRTLASLLRKAGFTIRTLDNVDTEIVENFADLDTASFGKFYKSLASQLIPKESRASASNKYAPRVDIYNVPDTELEADIDEASLAELGAILSPEEKAKFLPIQKALMQKGTRTEYRKGPKGAIITEQTPRFTRQMGKEAVAEAIEKAPEYKADVERKERVDFFKWITERN
jgi:hypothetical protein